MSLEYSVDFCDQLLFINSLDDYDDYEYDDDEKGPALEIYGTDITLSPPRTIRRMFWS